MKRFFPLLLLLAAVPVVAQNPTVRCPQAGSILCPDNSTIRATSMPYFTPYQQPPAPQLAGLWVIVGQGQIVLANTTVVVPAARMAVQPSTTNYLYVDLATATVGVNTTGFNTITDLFFPVAIAVTNATFVTTLADVRPDVFGGGTSGRGSCITTVANLSNACGITAGTIASVTDGSNSSDCTIGGGTSKNVCIYTGTMWAFAGSAASNPSFNQVGSGTNANVLLVSGSLAPITAGTITASNLNGPYIDWNALSGGAVVQNKPTLNIWSNLLSPLGNLSLPTGTNTTTFTAGDFGATPSIANTFTDNATTTTDTTTNVLIGTGTSSKHNPFTVQVQGINQFQICTVPATQGEILFGSAVTCPNISQTPFAKTVFAAFTPANTVQRLVQTSTSPTGTMEQYNFTSAPGTGFNVWTFATGCSATDTQTGCTTQASLRGDGLLSVPNEVISSLTPGTTPVCPNGTGGELTTVGCSGGGSGFPSGVGIAGAIVSGSPITSAEFLPPVDVRLFFTTPYPTYAQAQGQDFGAVLNAALVAATSSGACVDASGLNLLNAPNVTVLYATTNPYSGLTSNTYTPCIIGANFTVVTGATWETPGGALRIEGGVPGGIGTAATAPTGFVIQPCNTTGNCSNGSGGIPVTPFPTSAGCASSGGLNCYATGLPSSSALTTYTTGTVTCTNGTRTCTGSGTTWTSAMIGGTFLSSCASNTCTIGSTSSYVTGRIVAVGSTTSLTLEANWGGLSTGSEKYIIFNPNTAVAFCDGCLGNNLQKSFTGHDIRNLTVDLNGISGAGFYTKSSQEGSILDNFTCFMQYTNPPPTGATAGGTCLAWDQSVREASGSGQTFLGHWSVYGGRIGMGTNAGGSNAYGVVVEGFSLMDGSVALSQANGPSVFELQAIIGGSGSAKFQDDAYIDGITGMYIAGTHTESSFNDHWEVGAVNPTYNVSLNNITSSGTLGNCVVELHTGTSANRVSGVSRPSGGCLAADDGLITPTLATSISGTPSSWTMPEYIQQGNAGVAFLASGNAVITGAMTANSYQWVGPPYISGPIPSAAMSPTTTTNSAIGISSDGNLYLSNNGGAINEFANLGNANTWLAGQTFNGELLTGVTTKTSSYTGNSTIDSGNLIIMNCTAACTYTLNGSPSNGYFGAVESIGSTVAAVSLNSKHFNGSTSVPVLISDQPVFFWSDGTNYFGNAPPIAGSNITLTAASNGLTITSSASAGATAESSITAPTTTNTITETAAGDWTARNGVETANLTAPWSFADANSTNNNTNLGLLAGVSGSSTGGIAALFYDASGTGDLARFYSGGSVSSNAYTVGTLEASITTGGIINATSGYKVAAATPTAGHYLRANGTAFIDGTIAAGDLPNNIPVGNVGSAGLSGTSPISIVSTGAISCASCVTSNASLTSNQAVNGSGSQGSATGFTDTTGTVTSGHLACYTSTNTIGNCTGTPSNNIIGVFNSSSTWIASGEASVTLDASGNVTDGDILCASTSSAGTSHDNGSTYCSTGAMIGIVKTTATSVSSATAFVTLSMACPTCVTSAASLTAHAPMVGEGSQTSATIGSAGTSGQVLTSQGSSTDPHYIDFPERFYIPAANCNNTTAGAGWSIGSGGTVACRAGTNNLGGAIQITDTSSTFAQFTVMLPVDWDTGTNPYIKFYFSVVTDTTSGHTVIPQIKVSCPTAANGTTSDDATFSAAQSSGTVTLGGSAVANGFYNGSSVQIGSTQMTGCIAGGMMIVQVGRATDTVTGNVNFWGADLTFPRQVVVQAN